VAFDAMPYGNSPRTQFLDSGLGNNASVPFPAAALAGMLLAEPVERWYVAAAGFDRQSDAFDWDYSNAFEDWMVVGETGVVAPLWKPDRVGSYYVGYWYSTFPGAPDGQGVYVGVAQELYREPGEGNQGLGLFARYGYADRNPSGIRHYWSVGGQYQGLVPERDDDVLAFGWAQAFTREPPFSASYEGALELYYRARLTAWLHASPHIQYIANPGSSDADDAWTLGIRGQVTF
jgi:carbohydrate-selective porin OprB